MTPEEFIHIQNALGLNNKAMAEALQVNINTISYWRHGRRTISAMAERAIGLLIEKRARDLADFADTQGASDEQVSN